MSTNGHVVAATWRAEDFADLETLVEPLAVDIFEGKRPPVVIDPRGYEMLVFCGHVGNPLIADAVAAYETQNRRTLQQNAEIDTLERAAEIRDLHDKVLAAICLQPRYCAKSQLVNGRPPAGQLWFGAFTNEQRRALVQFFYTGADALKSLPAAAQPSANPARGGERLSPAAEPDTHSASSTVSPVVAGRSGPPLEERAGRSGTDGDRERVAYS